MTKIVIRPFVPDERDVVIDLLQELNRIEDGFIGDRPTDRASAEACLAYDEAHIAASEGGALLVAVEDGVVLGFLALSIEKGVPFVREELRRHGRVMDLVIAEAARGGGIGSALLKEAEGIARRAGCRSVLVGVVHGNEKAQAAYAKNGFQPYTLDMLKPID